MKFKLSKVPLTSTPLVALPVSAWIEIFIGLSIFCQKVVALPVSAWIEIQENGFDEAMLYGRTPRECVD